MGGGGLITEILQYKETETKPNIKLKLANYNGFMIDM